MRIAHKENTHSEIFLIYVQAKNFHCILFSYGSWLKYLPYKVLISSRKILAHSPNTLKEAKVRKKKLKSLSYILYLGYNDMVKKTISRYRPFKAKTKYLD
jgi:hypothetical protein